MRRSAILIFAFFTAAVAMGQNLADPQMMTQLTNRLSLSEQEAQAILRAYRETEEIIREADLELDIHKAQLAKLLYPADVDMRAVEALLKQSYEWQLQRQLAQIRRQVEIRQILGDERWTQYSRLIRAIRQRAAGDAERIPERPGD